MSKLPIGDIKPLSTSDDVFAAIKAIPDYDTLAIAVEAVKMPLEDIKKMEVTDIQKIDPTLKKIDEGRALTLKHWLIQSKQFDALQDATKKLSEVLGAETYDYRPYIQGDVMVIEIMPKGRMAEMEKPD